MDNDNTNKKITNNNKEGCAGVNDHEPLRQNITVGILSPTQEYSSDAVVDDESLECIERIIVHQQSLEGGGGEEEEWSCRRLDPNRNFDELRECHVLVIPGGFVHKIARLFTNEIKAKVRQWRRQQKGGLVGICAGAIVACGGEQGHFRDLLSKEECQGRVQVLESTHFDTADLIGHVQIGMDDDSNITSQLPPDRVRDALQAIGGQRVLPYYNGPLFVVKDSVVTETTSRTPTKPATSRVHVWAQYESDLFSEMRKTMEENHESTVHHKSQGQSGKHWQCSVCNKFAKRRQRLVVG